MAQPEYKGGFLRVASAESTADAARKTDEEKAALNSTPKPEITSLYSYLWNIWEQNRRHKESANGVQDQMIANLQARNNEYSSAKLQEIKAAGMPDVYMGLTNVKCAHAEDWLLDIYSSAASDRTWGLKPTPVPEPVDDLMETVEQKVIARVQAAFEATGEPPTREEYAAIVAEQMQDADDLFDEELLRRTKDMETKIFDQMTEGGWPESFGDFITDVVTLKAGIVKGPIARKKKKITYDGGKRKVVTEDRPEYWRVSPLDIYPSPTAECINDGSLVEKVNFSRKDLIDLKDEDGYDKDAINRVLSNFSYAADKIHTVNDEEREDVEDKDEISDTLAFREDLEGLEFWCPVQGKMLLQHGIDKIPGVVEKIKPLEEYEINAIVTSSEVIYVALNDDELGRRPYSKTGWRKVPGSFWYKGVPELMEDLQRIINAAVRSMCYNMSMASGPQVDVDVSRLVPGENLESSFPGKVWQTTNPGNTSAPAVRFFNPNSNSAELFSIYENFAKLADDYTGIPAYAYGSDKVAGAGRTSSGLSMLMTAAAKGIKRVILGIDQDIFKTVVRRQFDWNMQYLDDPNLKGDIDIVTTGAVAVMIKEQMSERRMQFLAATQNELDSKLTGMSGRAHVLREAASALEMDNVKVVKDVDEVNKLSEDEDKRAAEAHQAEMQAQQSQAQLQLQSIQLENEMKKLQLSVEQQKMAAEQQKIQIELQQAQMEAETARHKMQIEEAKMQLESAKLGLASERNQIDLADKQTRDERERAKIEAGIVNDSVSQLKDLEALGTEEEAEVAEAAEAEVMANEQAPEAGAFEGT